MTIDPAFKIILAASFGFMLKIIWDWLKTGRVDKGEFVTGDHCEEIRERCCMPTMKREVGILKSEVKAHEKKLDEGRADFQLLRDDINLIKETLAGIKSVLDAVLKRVEL